MQYRNNKTRLSAALTLLEMVIAMAIMAIIFAVIVLQFRVIQNSWDSQVGAAETLQNGRVLMDHLYRNLSKAVRITAVSGSAETNGYVEFQDNDANNIRYDVNSTTNYVQFGAVGDLSELAGPVSQLQFTCYDGNDLDTPITDVTAIRCVKVETTLSNTGPGQDKGFSTWAYLRTNFQDDDTGGEGWTISKPYEPWLEFDPDTGMEPALVHMSGTKYHCAYRGDRDDGYACIFTVDTGDWSVSASGFLEYDTKNGGAPALARIDDGYSLCAYRGDGDDGWACVLYELGAGGLDKASTVEFDTEDCWDPALCKIKTDGNDHYYLCAYANTGTGVQALVLQVTLIPYVMMNLTAGPAFPFDVGGTSPALSKIDDTHYLCAYTGGYGDGWSIVLTVDTVDWTVCGVTLFGFDPYTCVAPALSKIDDTHYLCAYEGADGDGWAVVLNVDTGNWTISQGTNFEYDTVQGGAPDLSKINNTDFLCAYSGPGGAGMAVVLTVNTGDWTISKGTPFTFDPAPFPAPALCQIDAGHYLCAIGGTDAHGFTGVLEVTSGVPPLMP